MPSHACGRVLGPDVGHLASNAAVACEDLTLINLVPWLSAVWVLVPLNKPPPKCRCLTIGTASKGRYRRCPRPEVYGRLARALAGTGRCRCPCGLLGDRAAHNRRSPAIEGAMIPLSSRSRSQARDVKQWFGRQGSRLLAAMTALIANHGSSPVAAAQGSRGIGLAVAVGVATSWPRDWDWCC